MHRAAVVRRPALADVEVIQGSLAAVRLRPAELTEVFYGHLFAMAPALRAMFPGDLTPQMQKMSTTLLTAIATLGDAYVGGHDEQLDKMERSLQRLGAAHRDRFQVQAAHYLYIPHALTRAVRDVAGATWSGSLSSSWIALTMWVNGHMLAGAGALDADPGIGR
jgi:hemoglobin-like flavoprotein